MIFECLPSSIVKRMRTNEIWKFPGNYVLRWKIGQQRVTRIQSAKSSGWVNFRALQEYVRARDVSTPAWELRQVTEAGEKKECGQRGKEV